MSRYLKAALLLIACASSIAVGSLRAEDSESDPHTRLAQETKELFRFIKSSEAAPKKERCSVESVWNSYPVPEKVARAQFGLTLHADLAPVYQSNTPSEVFALAEGYEDAFCTAEKIGLNFKDIKIKFESGDNASDSATSVIYTLPVFNEEYTRAIIIYSGKKAS